MEDCMLENWYVSMELARIKNETILKNAQNMRINRMENGSRDKHHSAVSIYLLGGLGRAFSSLGDSLQSHYHFSAHNGRVNMKKVS